jgi:hypothetical protein
MAKQVVDVGSKANDGSGDSLREAGIKINANFTEIYTALGGVSGNVSVVSKLTGANGMIVSNPTGDITLTNRIATTTQLGVFKVGNNLSINSEGVLSANAGAYTLPTATGSVLGGVKIGSRLSISNGVLSADVQSSQVSKLVNGANEVVLQADGTLLSPGGSWTKTTNNDFSSGITSQVVWTSTEDSISGAKLTIQVEANEPGGLAGWDTQVCEAVIAVRGHNTTSIPVMSVYGVTHTSEAPLMTFTVDRNPTTSLIEITGTRTETATSAGGASLRIYSVETGTND